METLISRSLSILGVEPICAATRKEAVAYATEHRDLSMVLVSSQLGREHGLELVEELRRHYSKIDLPIVALMDEHDTEDLIVQFLRHGATDTIVKHLSTPLSIELFRSRILQNLRQVISYREMQLMAQRDFLTGMFNRRYFFSHCQPLFANFQRGNITLAIAMLDIDHFKHINDTYGHPQGDKVIISVAKILEKTLRKSDIAARFGGEEFCIVLTGTDAENAIAVVERIRQSVETTIHETDLGEQFQFTLSAGITVQTGDSLEQMVQKSDDLLYSAKKSGRNRTVSDL